MVDVCLLGCGGMIPLHDRRLSSLLIRYNGKMILVDCGEGTQVGIRDAGWGFKHIDMICFTHYHADHIAGLPGFLLTLGNSGRTEPLTILGPPMLYEVVSALTVICPELPFEIKLIELDKDAPSEHLDCEMIIHSLPVDHWMPCLAYSFELERQPKFDIDKANKLGIPIQFWNKLQSGTSINYNNHLFEPYMVLGEKRKGIKISYCTDSRPTNELAVFCNRSDLLVCEGMYGSNDMLSKAIEKKHMIFSEAAAIAAESCSEQLWLTHFSPSLDTPEMYIENATSVFSNSHIGRDMKMTTLKWKTT